jgi:hypothetical protein
MAAINEPNLPPFHKQSPGWQRQACTTIRLSWVMHAQTVTAALAGVHFIQVYKYANHPMLHSVASMQHHMNAEYLFQGPDRTSGHTYNSALSLAQCNGAAVASTTDRHHVPLQ